jgi:hypothetical protein
LESPFGQEFYMPRPQRFPVKRVIGFDKRMLDAIDEWRREQTAIPSMSGAIRQLLEFGLKEVDWSENSSRVRTLWREDGSARN